MTITVTGNKVSVNKLFHEDFTIIMGKLEIAYKTNKPYELSPSEGFVIDNSIQLLMDIIQENSILFALLEKQGLIGFEEATLQ